MAFNPYEFQRNIRANNEELNGFMKDFGSWASEINDKDEKLKAGDLRLTTPSAAPVRSSVPVVLSEEAAQDAQAEFTAAKAQGNDRFKEGKYQEAVECYSRCISLCPEQAVGHSNRAMAHLKLTMWTEAAADCTASLELDDTNVKVLYRRALARQQLHKFKLGLNDVSRAVGLEPTNRNALNLKASLTKAVKLQEAQAEKARLKREAQVKAAMEREQANRPRRRKVLIEEVSDDEDGAPQAVSHSDEMD